MFSQSHPGGPKTCGGSSMPVFKICIPQGWAVHVEGYDGVCESYIGRPIGTRAVPQ